MRPLFLVYGTLLGMVSYNFNVYRWWAGGVGGVGVTVEWA